MIVPLEALIVWLRADAALVAAVGNQYRIANKHNYNNSSTAWTQDQPGVVLTLEPGAADIYVPWQRCRIAVQVYAKPQLKALEIFNEIIRVARGTEREVVTTSKGKAMIYWFNQDTTPSADYDETLKMDVAFGFFELAVAEQVAT